MYICIGKSVPWCWPTTCCGWNANARGLLLFPFDGVNVSPFFYASSEDH